ncbi:MAG TPA: glycosyltransferase, partial [Pyrinomonadaceae bacterium]|nr:glycosyltransferase [Pyrinomonadaceae bacterium]
MIRKFRTAVETFREAGLNGIKAKLRRIYRKRRATASYPDWIKLYDTLTDEDRSKIRLRIEKLARKPLISIVVPIYNIEEKWLRSCLESVLKQLYPHWELCLADDCSPAPHVRRVLEEYAAKDVRIKIVFRETNGHISAASNSALLLATGEFVALLDHDDELSEHALYFVAEEINAFPAAEMIYSDEDKIDENGKRSEPFFKPDWSSDFFYSVNYTTHFAVYRRELLERIGGFREGFEGSQDYDLALRVSEQVEANQIRHIPRILYHWRAIPGSVALGGEQKSYAHERAREAIRSHFDRAGIEGIEIAEGFGMFHRVVYPLPGEPLVSLILTADGDEKELLPTVENLLAKTNYQNLELVIFSRQTMPQISGDSRVRIVAGNKSGAAIERNLAAGEARGEILIFVQNGLRVTEKDWLREMVSHSRRKEVGAVGARLLF